MSDLVDKHDNPWLQIEQLQMEIERLTKQWDTACAAAEDRHEFVLAQINAGLKGEIARLKAEGAKHVDEINHLWDVIDKLRDGRSV